MTEINLERFRKIQIYLEQTRYFQVNLDNAKKIQKILDILRQEKFRNFQIYLVIFRSIPEKNSGKYI